MSIVWFLKCCYKLCINVFETKSPGKQVCFPSRWSQETSRLAEKRNKLNISGPGIKCVYVIMYGIGRGLQIKVSVDREVTLTFKTTNVAQVSCTVLLLK